MDRTYKVALQLTFSIW